MSPFHPGDLLAVVAETDTLKVAGVAISPDQRYAYIAGGGTIYTFDVSGVS